MDQRILTDLQERYGLICGRITPVTGGLLNLKWKVTTDQGQVLVKQYSTKRFCGEQFDKIEAALQRQVILHKNAVPCPFLWQLGGRALRRVDDQTIYMVMDFCPGNTRRADQVTVSQMNSLGGVCGAMHRAFSLLPEPADKCLPASGGYSVGALWENLRAQTAQCPPDAPAEYRNALRSQELILKRISTDFFNRFPKGFAHEDFHSGNLLFHTDCVSAIVDFDRNCYSYIWHDVGRALLSFALEDGKMNAEKVLAFKDGYCGCDHLTLADLANALRLTWCIESPWWIRPEFFQECEETPKRFQKEILWLTNHWFELDAILSS